MENFIYTNFIRPIVEKTGYNPVNTATYAIIAIVVLYVIWKLLEKNKFTMDKKFIYGTLAFVLFGSTLRVVTDAVDNGVLKPVTILHELALNSHIYDYGYLTVTPGIYMLVAALFLATLLILNSIKKQEYLLHVGLLFWLPHILLLLPFMNFAQHLLPIIILTIIPALIIHKLFKNDVATLMVAGHALDGAATFYVIDIFGPMVGKGYFEQHVIGSFIGEYFHTFFAFYLFKVLLVSGIAKVMIDDKDDSENFRNFVALAIMIMGFAPGIRDILRMIVGA
ncbi:MAG: DUF63 family protein [Candidatus Micrarchaeota archaeon]|nr:DUF63 family protein [Candidatus Micrarchaeota archaeon]